MASGYIHQGISKEEIQVRNTLPCTRIEACLKIHKYLHGKISFDAGRTHWTKYET
jgi:hypothetical protein